MNIELLIEVLCIVKILHLITRINISFYLLNRVRSSLSCSVQIYFLNGYLQSLHSHDLIYVY